MTNSKCPYREHCKLFNNKLDLNKPSEEIYKSLYCLTNRWNKCKRYLAIKQFGTTPNFIMPNSTYSIDCIGNKIEEEQFLRNYIYHTLL